MVSILIAFIMCCFSYLKNLGLGFLMLDTSLIAPQYMPLLLRFLHLFSIPLDRQLDPLSQFFGVHVCQIDARYLLDLSRSFCCRYLLNISQSIEILFSIPSQSIELGFLYISKVQPESFQTQLSRYLSLLSRSKSFFFTKILLPIPFSASIKLQSSGKWSKSLLFLFSHHFHAFCDLTVGFLKNLGFLSLYEIFWVRFC